MENTNFYYNSHLVIAAIRILEYKDKIPPSIEKVCDLLSFSLESGNLICRKLKEMNILEILEGAYGNKLFIKEHIKIEEIPNETKETDIDEEVKKYMENRKAYT
ncbi:MAG: hypothetical protein HQK78_14555, partial [Desulfobacterales bacterium]|nr:hypothetical protein [Desulfobacterales bacterium]